MSADKQDADVTTAPPVEQQSVTDSPLQQSVTGTLQTAFLRPDTPVTAATVETSESDVADEQSTRWGLLEP